MPAIKVELHSKKETTTVVELNSVPRGLCTSVTRQYNTLKDLATPGLPAVRKDKSGLRTITFPDISRSLPDRIRYYYQSDGSLTEDTDRTLASKKGYTLPVGVAAKADDVGPYKDGSIVLLLESPHVDEMKKGQPAAGDTGVEIDLRLKALGAILKPLIDTLCPDPTWSQIPVVIANPCPYPTSCLMSTSSWGSLRDLVFSKLFPLVEGDFKRRLTQYKPLVIINACTDGAKPGHILRHVKGTFRIEREYAPPSPKDLVLERIQEWIGTARCFERRYYSNDQKNATFKEKAQNRSGCEDRPVAGFLLDLGHPSSWKTSRQQVTAPGTASEAGSVTD